MRWKTRNVRYTFGKNVTQSTELFFSSSMAVYTCRGMHLLAVALVVLPGSAFSFLAASPMQVHMFLKLLGFGIPILSYQDNQYNPIQYNPIHPKRLLGACKNYVVHSWDFSRFVPSHGVQYSWRSPMHYVVCVRVCVPGITLPFPCFAWGTLCFSCFCVSACMHTFVMELVCVCVCVCVCVH